MLQIYLHGLHRVFFLSDGKWNIIFKSSTPCHPHSHLSALGMFTRCHAKSLFFLTFMNETLYLNKLSISHNIRLLFSDLDAFNHTMPILGFVISKSIFLDLSNLELLVFFHSFSRQHKLLLSSSSSPSVSSIWRPVEAKLLWVECLCFVVYSLKQPLPLQH